MRKVLIGLVLFGFASFVVAAEEAFDQKGWVVGGGVGTAMLSIKPKNQPQLKSANENTTLYTVFGGYNFTDWFGIEFDVSKSSDFTDVNTGFDAYIVGTSFTPKFTHHFNKDFAVYFKPGFQYIAYEQTIEASHQYDITWNGIDPFVGVGLQYSFPPGIRVRLDYKYSNITLDRSENSIYGYDLYDEEIDLVFSAISFTANYQF